MVDGSDVSVVSELVSVIQTNRYTADTAKMIETMYDLERRTSNTFARPAQG